MRVLGRDIIVDIQHHKDSAFGKEIFKLFESIRPTKIIETGTYLGLGSTLTIASAIKKLDLDCLFFSIEINPQYIEKARENLGVLIKYVTLERGLSIPREMLPTFEQLQNGMVDSPEFDNILVDHRKEDRVNLYMGETDYHGADEMLKICLHNFSYHPDFVLLDSGGHVGYLEFSYLLSLLKGDCWIALDDIFHVKHHKSFLQIESDKRFSETIVLKEGTGQCLTKFTKI